MQRACGPCQCNFRDKPQGKKSLYSCTHTVEYNIKVDPEGNRERKSGSLYCNMVGFYVNGNEPAYLKLSSFLTATVLLCYFDIL
jgi:hypothetical protein